MDITAQYRWICRDLHTKIYQIPQDRIFNPVLGYLE